MEDFRCMQIGGMEVDGFLMLEFALPVGKSVSAYEFLGLLSGISVSMISVQADFYSSLSMSYSFVSNRDD